MLVALVILSMVFGSLLLFGTFMTILASLIGFIETNPLLGSLLFVIVFTIAAGVLL